MKIYITPSGKLNIEASPLALRGAEPVLNGQVLPDYQVDVLQNNAAVTTMRYSSSTLGAASFFIEVVREKKHFLTHIFIIGSKIWTCPSVWILLVFALTQSKTCGLICGMATIVGMQVLCGAGGTG